MYLLFHSFNATEGRDGLSFGYQLSKLSKVVWFAPYKRTLSNVRFKIIITMTIRGCVRRSGRVHLMHSVAIARYSGKIGNRDSGMFKLNSKTGDGYSSRVPAT